MAEMSRKGRLSLRSPSRPSGEDRRETETFPSTRTSCHISQELESPAGYELSVPRSIFHEKKSSPLHGRALLFSYEEVHSQQSCEANFVLSSGSPIPIALHDSKHKFQIQIPPIRRTHEGDENLVDTPPDSPRIEKDESWACSACTFLNKLISECCELCDTPRGNGKRNAINSDEESLDAVNNDEPTASDSDYEDNDSVVDIQSDGSAEERDNEEDSEADNDVELMFQQCLPVKNAKAFVNSPEVVDLTDIEKKVPITNRSMNRVEDIEDFEDDDPDNISSSHPFLEHFRTVKDLHKGGYHVIDFNKFVLSSAPNSRGRLSTYDTRREKRNEKKTETKKRRSAGSPRGKKGYYKKRSKRD